MYILIGVIIIAILAAVEANHSHVAYCSKYLYRETSCGINNYSLDGVKHRVFKQIFTMNGKKYIRYYDEKLVLGIWWVLFKSYEEVERN